MPVAAPSTSYCADSVSHSQAMLGGNHFSFPFTYFTGTGVTVTLAHLNNAPPLPLQCFLLCVWQPCELRMISTGHVQQ